MRFGAMQFGHKRKRKKNPSVFKQGSSFGEIVFFLSHAKHILTGKCFCNEETL